MTDQPNETFNVVYLGLEQTADNKNGASIITLDQCNENPGRAQWRASVFNKRAAMFSVIGGVYSVEGIRDETGKVVRYVPTSAKFIETWRDGSNVVASWEARDLALRTADAAARAEAKAAKDSSLGRLVQSLRFVYRTIPSNQRMGFKVWLLAELEKF